LLVGRVGECFRPYSFLNAWSGVAWSRVSLLGENPHFYSPMVVAKRLERNLAEERNKAYHHHLN